LELCEGQCAEIVTEKYTLMAHELLAKHMIAPAKQGERDQGQLSQEALLLLSRSNLKVLFK
jgi:hypothetical protein